MLIVKNTYGISTVISPKAANYDLMDTLGGSSLDRKKYPKKVLSEIEMLLKAPLEKTELKKSARLERTMSKRSKGKIRRKLISFARLHKKLSFVTLTFCNQVEDSLAVKILAKFLENVNKLTKDFQYLWVAEKQTENELFKDNIHFHLITNKFWNIKKWWQYWLDLQAKNGIRPRDENFKPSSAFDVKQVSSNNIKGIVNYLTKYVTKNSGKFGCQVWNCSKKISRLYTDFYSDLSFIHQLERLESEDQLGGEIKTIPLEYCNLFLIPLNRITMNFYNKIDDKNKTVWEQEPTGKEVSHD